MVGGLVLRALRIGGIDLFLCLYQFSVLFGDELDFHYKRLSIINLEMAEPSGSTAGPVAAAAIAILPMISHSVTSYQNYIWQKNR